MTRTFVLTVTPSYFLCSCGEQGLCFTAEAAEKFAALHAAEHVAAGDRPATCGKCGEAGDSPWWTAKCG